jgi:RimJ/RimL family protein N-acetyltransferase
MPFIPAYRIVTPQLVLRCYNPCDAPLLAAAITESLEHLRPWMPWAASEPESVEVKISHLRRFRANFDQDVEYVFGIFNLQETRLLGGTGLHRRVGPNALEIGYWIHKDYLNRGFATEASAALTRVAFELHRVERVEIHCATENVRSAAVPRKLGYTHEATLKDRSTFYDHKCDQLVWSLFAGDYPHSPAAQLEIAAYDAAERRIV